MKDRRSSINTHEYIHDSQRAPNVSRTVSHMTTRFVVSRNAAVVNGESVKPAAWLQRSSTQRRRPSARNAREIRRAAESPAGVREREQQPLSTLAVLTRVERVELRQRDDTIVSPGLYGCRSWLGLAHCTGVAIHISIDSCALL